MTNKDGISVEGVRALLERKAYRREMWLEPEGTVDVPCDAEDDGAVGYFVNPDGPEVLRAYLALSEQVGELEEIIYLHVDPCDLPDEAIEKVEAIIQRAALSHKGMDHG